MTDTSAGARDRAGDWWPADPIQMPAPFVWPPRPVAVLRWLFGYPGYLWPLNALYLAIATATWFFLTPELAAMRTFEAGWVAAVFGRNVALAIVVYGGLHGYLYVLKAQGTRFKYTSRPQATKSRAFLFGSQVWDNVFWTLTSGVTVWTAYEVITLWAFANGFLPFGGWAANPVWFGVLLAAVPFVHNLHFYLIHRLLHWRPLYDAAHYLHHRNVNPAPWSGLSMHPLEHLVYFSGVLVLWAIAPHPIHGLFLLQLVALAPALGHCGFDRVVLGGERALMANTGFHYLHHKHFECNYSGELLPIPDKWFGTFHDGSDEAHARLKERLTRR
ncbi:MAG: sterol desaturase family protein [Proteobacteria bacterium]|nr:sterol desaturase family protein [Pseudomonadota bacterium]